MEPYLEGLNEPQRKAVLHERGPLLIIAGAGAGKTTTITRRIARLIASGVPGPSIPAVTFTNKAAREMRERVLRLLPAHVRAPFMSTFHTLGVRILREFHAEAGVPKHFTIWDRDDSTRAVKRILKEMRDDRSTPRQVLGAFSKAKGQGMTHQEYRDQVRGLAGETAAHTWEAYEQTLRSEGALDFEDLLVRTRNLLRDNERVRGLLQHRWQHITIDEYQDTNAVQYDIARLLTGPEMNICVVGDVDQCLYSWRNADIRNLLQFEHQFPGTATVVLEENYRSTGTILTAANAIIEKNRNRVPKKLFTRGDIGEAIGIYGAINEMDEAYFVAEHASRLIASGTKASEIAVLYRENFQSRALEEALLHRRLPYRVLGTRFFERAEVKDVLAYLRAALNPDSKADVARIIGTPPRGLGKTTMDKVFAGQEAGLNAGARGSIFAHRGLYHAIR
jgi:DNA helicase-2/ATP-dependent DNA helicase PcrA